MLTAEKLREQVHYDPETGAFTWLVSKGPAVAGIPAGCVRKRYVALCFGCKHYYAHRIAWLYMTGEWPSATIDHIDRDTHNNKWANLRLATMGEQRQNSMLSRRNKSGHKGVSWSEQRGKWVASIGHNGKRIPLGRYEAIEDAIAAYAQAKERLHTFHPVA